MYKSQLKLGSFLSYAQMALSIIIGLIYTPMMIKLLGTSEYGLYNTVASTISMLSVISLGFNSSYIRYYAKYKKNADEKSIYKLNGLFLIIFLVIGSIALVCGIFLSFNLNLVFDKGLRDSEYQIARVLMLLLTASLAGSFPMSVFSNIISANERYIFLKLLGMIKTVVSPFITIPLLLMGYRSIAIVTVSVIISLITDIAHAFYVLFVLKNKFLFRDFEKGLFFNMLAYTAFIAINMIIDQINGNIDKLLLGRFKGTNAVAVYSVGYSLYMYYVMFSTSVSNVFTPKIHKIVNDTSENPVLQKLQLTELFVKVGRIQYIILAFIATGIIFFGQRFILDYLAGIGYEDSYWVTLLLVIPSSIALIQNLGIEIQRAENKHSFRSIVYAGMATMNLVLSIFLCQKYGAIGSAIGTAISLILANGIVMNIYYHKKCNINILLFWKNIASITVGLIVPVVCGIVIDLMFDLTSTPKFLLAIFIYSLTYLTSMWLLGMNTYEKDLIKKPLQKWIGRKYRD